jgi:D-Tyr-tRNAtyr deacylase
LKDVGGEMLVVSQFTLYADCSRKKTLLHRRGRPCCCQEPLRRTDLEVKGRESL